MSTLFSLVTEAWRGGAADVLEISRVVAPAVLITSSVK